MIYIFYEFNTLDQYAIYVKNINYRILVCPSCLSKGNFKIHKYYSRNIIYLDNEGVKSNKLKIKVIKCKSCKHTHALLPCFIIPYHIYSTELIMNSLKDKFNHHKIDSICEKFDISYQLLYSWVHRFNEHSVLCKALFNQGLLSFKQLIELILSFDLISSFLEMYFKDNRLFFMQFISSA